MSLLSLEGESLLVVGDKDDDSAAEIFLAAALRAANWAIVLEDEEEEGELSPFGGSDDAEEALLKEVCLGICFGIEGGGSACNGGDESEFSCCCCCCCGGADEVAIGPAVFGLELSWRRRAACMAI